MKKDSVFDLNAQQKVLYNDIHTLIISYIKPKDPESLSMTAGTLLAVAIQLYVAACKDEEICDLLEDTKKHVPKLREFIKDTLRKQTVH